MAKFGKDAAKNAEARIGRWKTALSTHAHATGVPASVVAAIITRETAALDDWCLPPPKGRLGDGGHGHGPMQIDDRSFPEWCKQWRDGALATEDGILQGCKVLKMKIRSITRLIPEMPESERLRAAVAAYNCGEGNVRKAFRAQKDLDVYTAHANYSKDVMERAAYFHDLGYDV